MRGQLSVHAVENRYLGAFFGGPSLSGPQVSSLEGMSGRRGRNSAAAHGAGQHFLDVERLGQRSRRPLASMRPPFGRSSGRARSA